LPSILTPQAVHDIAIVCMGRPQEGQDVESSFFAIIINISIIWEYVKNNLDIFTIIPIFFDFQKPVRKPFCRDLYENPWEIVRKIKKSA